MRLSGLILLLLAAASPAAAQSANTSVTVLRGATAPPPADPPSPVVVQVFPQIAYAPTYSPDYSVYPGYFFPGPFTQPHHFAQRPFTPTVKTMGTMTGRITGVTSSHK